MKRKIGAILAAFAFMLTGAVVSAPPASADLSFCYMGWNGPFYETVGGTDYVRGIANIGCRGDVVYWHSALLALKKKNTSGEWITVPGSPSGWADAPNGTTITLSTFRQQCQTYNNREYRLEWSHRINNESIHYHQSPTQTLPCNTW